MILILSHVANEDSTNQVIDWLEHKNADYTRINGNDLRVQKIEFNLSDSEHSFDVELEDSIPDLDDVNIVWFRRWTWNNKGYGPQSAIVEELKDEPQLSTNIKKHLNNEFGILSGSFYHKLSSKKWLSHPAYINPNKLNALNYARRAGIHIPPTIITSHKEALQNFKDKWGRIITKPIKDTMAFQYKKTSSNLFTTEVTQEDIDKHPDRFYPSLFQQLIEKEYELRVFYLDKKFYPMAIFSQLDKQTEVDFRVYNEQKPNRNVPYKLPEDLEKKLILLMEKMRCPTGSIDILKSKDGRYIFLEVNPVGQLGMTSIPCNYQLEEKIADYLIQQNNEQSKTKKPNN